MKIFRQKKLIDGLYADIGSIISTAMSAYKDTNAVKYKFKIDSVQAGDEAFNKEFENILKEPLKKIYGWRLQNCMSNIMDERLKK